VLRGSPDTQQRRSLLPASGTARALIALTVVAAVLRLIEIGHQSLWFDEAYTVMLVKLPFGRMLGTIPKTESTPYLYYLLAWVWTHIFGRGAADLRALSAVFGTAVVPVAYLTTVKLLENRRAALCVASLAAFNPLLIWYSQEARAYELLVLTAACTLLAFAYAREQPTTRRLALWAAACGVALVSHYDTALVVVPEAVWLLAQHRRTLGPWLATAFVAACGGGLLPLLIEQSNAGNAAWIKKAPLNDRLGQILSQFIVGTGSHAYLELMWLGFLLGAVALVLLVAGGGGRDQITSTERRIALGVGALALGGFALVMAVDAAGSDTVLTRNLLALWLPLAIVLAAGLGSRRAGRLGIGVTALLCAIGVTATISVATFGTLQKPDWAAVAKTLGRWPRAGQPADATRLLIFPRNIWLESLTQVYMPHTSRLRRHEPRNVAEIDIVVNSSPAGAEQHWLCWWGAGCNLYPSRLAARYAIPGFHAAGRSQVAQFAILRLVSDKPRTVTQDQILSAMHAADLTLYGTLFQRT
jgi:uncharacterized membrane protein